MGRSDQGLRCWYSHGKFLCYFHNIPLWDICSNANIYAQECVITPHVNHLGIPKVIQRQREVVSFGSTHRTSFSIMFTHDIHTTGSSELYKKYFGHLRASESRPGHFQEDKKDQNTWHTWNQLNIYGHLPLLSPYGWYLLSSFFSVFYRKDNVEASFRFVSAVSNRKTMIASFYFNPLSNNHIGKTKKACWTS